MKAVLFSDTHLHNYQQFATVDETGLNSRAGEILKAVSEVFDYAVRNQIENVWFLGDLFHTRGKVDVRLFNEAYRLLSLAKGRGLKVILVAGNHDYVTEPAVTDSSKENSLFGFKEVVTAIVWDNPMVSDLWGPRVVFIPWGCTSWSKGELYVGHVQVEGVILRAGDLPLPGTVSPGVFDRPAFLGHIHARQDVGKNVHYIGALLPHTFGDVEPLGTWHGFCVLDLETLKFEFVGVKVPKFIVYAWDGSSGGGLFCRCGEEQSPCGNYIRIDVPSGTALPNEDALRRGLLSGEGAKAVVFNYEKEFRDERRIPELEASTPLEDSMRLYVEREAGGLDRERLLGVGRECLEEKK